MTQLYVNPTIGDDSRAGTDPKKPLKTIQAGVDKLIDSGGVLNLTGATYDLASSLSIAAPSKGARSTPLIIRQMPNDLNPHGGYRVTTGPPRRITAAPPVVIKGTGLSSGDQVILVKAGPNPVHLQGLDIQGKGKTGAGKGILASGTAKKAVEGLRIIDCRISGFDKYGIELVAAQWFLLQGLHVFDNGLSDKGYGGIKIRDLPKIDSTTLKPTKTLRQSQRGLVQGVWVHRNKGWGLEIENSQEILVLDCRASYNTRHGFDCSNRKTTTTSGILTGFPGTASRQVWYERCVSHDNGQAGFSVNNFSREVVYRRNIAWNNGLKERQPGFVAYSDAHGIWYVNNVTVENWGPGFGVNRGIAIRRGSGWRAKLEKKKHFIAYINNIAYERDGDIGWGKSGKVGPGSGATRGASGFHLADLNTIGIEGIHVFNNVIHAQRGIDRYPPARSKVRVVMGSNISADPMFVSTKFSAGTAPDVRLEKGSPARNAGRPAYYGWVGAAPDAGRWEMGTFVPAMAGETGSAVGEVWWNVANFGVEPWAGVW